MQLVQTALPLLFLLACPLLMALCFFGMRRMDRSSVQPSPASMAAARVDERVAALESEIATLRAELATLRAEALRPADPDQPVERPVDNISQLGPRLVRHAP